MPAMAERAPIPGKAQRARARAAGRARKPTWWPRLPGAAVPRKGGASPKASPGRKAQLLRAQARGARLRCPTGRRMTTQVTRHPRGTKPTPRRRRRPRTLTRCAPSRPPTRTAKRNRWKSWGRISKCRGRKARGTTANSSSSRAPRPRCTRRTGITTRPSGSRRPSCATGPSRWKRTTSSCASAPGFWRCGKTTRKGTSSTRSSRTSPTRARSPRKTQSPLRHRSRNPRPPQPRRKHRRPPQLFLPRHLQRRKKACRKSSRGCIRDGRRPHSRRRRR
mmetsp:Transcript_30860/g.73327  ORF Transcript_30860/g.73327 Transcript_30860/m.73327 type:complete len:277 (+) Transcript_30860:408-1238(+)